MYEFQSVGFEDLGKSCEAREKLGAGAELIHCVAKGLSDRELRKGFLQTEPIRRILSKAE